VPTAGVTFQTVWFLTAEHFTTRQWRSIESVLYHHPEAGPSLVSCANEFSHNFLFTYLFAQANITVFSNSLPSNFFEPLTAMNCRVSMEPIEFKKWALDTPLQPWANRYGLGFSIVHQRGSLVHFSYNYIWDHIVTN
jgi:hypothetical protein